ncbi:MAG: DNA mismatch repair protein MutS [Planctomycetota bacterium]
MSEPQPSPDASGRRKPDPSPTKKSATGTATTPAMAQFMAAKRQHPDALLFFRMGDFYELFHEDAKIASRAIGLTLTSRSKGDDPIPMAGVPVRSVDTYLKRLVQAGFKVAICEQMQDPREAKGVVERQVIRVVTPGTLTEDSLLDTKRKNFLAAVVGGSGGRGRAGLAWVELSTGEFRVHECGGDRLADELERLEPAELLLPEGAEPLERAAHAGHLCATARPAFEFEADNAERTLREFFSLASLAGFGLEDAPLAVRAAGALVRYLQETQLAALPHIRRIEVFQGGSTMLLDRATRTSLELVDTLRGAGAGERGTPLLAILDQTCTPMGARLLRDWLLAPLLEVAAIHERQSAVAELLGDADLRVRLRAELAEVHDLQRLTARTSCGRANARDLVALAKSLQRLPAVVAALDGCARQGALERLHRGFDVLADVAEDIASSLVDEPPVPIKEGGLIRPGHSSDLDELVELARDSMQWMARFQAREVERTGIQNLKVGFNRVFGYYIEITHAGARGSEIPADYHRKQTTKNAERYVTDELKTFETKVLQAEERSKALEHDLFLALRERAATATERLQDTAARVAELDCLLSLAQVAQERGYCRPTVDDSRVLAVKDGRHPVIEATHAAGTFVPNDTDLDPPRRALSLITGPNMAGKSTYIRQNALIVIMAQLGSFVPAAEARVGLVDRVFTRVGSADDISRGASTFMVEMVETANILNHATPRSLVILDEVGRGTSTFDGLSLAWAIAEDLYERIGCRALFATHYHQLTDLKGPGKGIVTQRVAVREWGEEIVFLHRIEEGGTDRSYGLHVARLAGIPKPVIERARTVLAKLEEEDEHVASALATTSSAKPARRQQVLFESPREKMLKDLAKLDPNTLTPMQALTKLAELVAQAKG